MLKHLAEIQKQEDSKLAPYAMKNKDSLGRVHPEKHDSYRLPFQHDRDRIIHCKSFRRLQAKTQVFVSYYGDHYRDRLTHSIEVSQIARDIARRLSLNEDLCECLALAHDLGHPPFGHGGETALNDAMQQYGLNFEHNKQSRRIIEKLEYISPGFDGLNATKEVLDGLLKHGPQNAKTYIKFKFTPHLETQVTDLADEIAYTNHDIDDGLRSGIITYKQISHFELWQDAEKNVRAEFGEVPAKHFKRLISRVVSKMISHLIEDLQNTAENNLKRYKINNITKVRAHKERLIDLSPEMRKKLEELRSFLFKNFYFHPEVEKHIKHGQVIIKTLFEHYRSNPDKMPKIYSEHIESGERLEVVVKDYIAGMTDRYAEEKFKALP